MSAVAMTAPLSSNPVHARWLLLAMHLPFIVFPVVQVTTGAPRLTPVSSPLALPLVFLASAIQIHHSLSVAQGIRPRSWMWTLPLLLLIVYVPFPFWGQSWFTLQWFAIASCAMLLPLTLSVPASIAVALGMNGWLAWIAADLTPLQTMWVVTYGSTVNLMGGWGLYGAARLVQLLAELRDARAALGETAIGRERLRISRDLHDLLGQSLSAVSLKGELAIGLLERDRPHRAIAEIESLVSVARSALHDMRHIPHRELPISLSKEIVRATDLLSAAGIEPELDIATENLSPPVEELFGWALREGVTNVLRHSAASTCTISVRKERDEVQMVIENDGTIGPAGDGHGLSGLAQRASSLSGSARGYAVGQDHFRLEVMVSEVAR